MKALWCSLGALAVAVSLAVAGAAQPPQQDAGSGTPVLKQRPPASPGQAAPAQHWLHIDAVVDDASGHAVPGLQPWDFKLTDNSAPSKILFLHGFDGVVSRPDPPVEVILLIDEINLPFTQVAFVKQQLTQFLSQNDGHLAQPVSLMLLSDSGLRVQQTATQDGNALLGMVRQISGEIRTVDGAMGSEGSIERLQRSVRQLQSIAVNEAPKPGRKLLVWIGPGWPMLDSVRFAPANDKEQKRYFQGIVELTNWLREARIAVYSVSGNSPNPNWDFVYKSFLGGVTNWHQAYAGNLALKVVVTQTGGLILGPDNDLTGQLNRCVADANRFYEIFFAPPAVEQPYEYHALRLRVDRPGLTVRTTSGYYADPAER